MKNIDQYYMKYAIKESKKAYKKGDVPVGTIIVKNNKILSKAYNKVEKIKDSTKHAEIIAISKASKKKKNWRLDDCVLYTTMEPCNMCCGAIEKSRIQKIVYGIKNEKHGGTKNLKNVEIKGSVCEEEIKNIVQNFFKKIR